MGNPWAIRRVRHLITLNNPHLIFLMETKFHEKKMESVYRRLGFNNGFDISAGGSKRGLSMAWKGNNVVSLIMLYRRDDSWRILNSLHDSQNGLWLVGVISTRSCMLERK